MEIQRNILPRYVVLALIFVLYKVLTEELVFGAPIVEFAHFLLTKLFDISKYLYFLIVQIINILKKNTYINRKNVVDE